MKLPAQLREEFWTQDAANGGWIRSQYDEIKTVLENRDLAWSKAQYRRIREHAIAHTAFYRDYEADDIFPVLNKLEILEHYEDHKADSGFLTPLHISSTSGSTGTPFSVIQDYKKRMRNIADLQVFGELCDYPPRERMVFFRVLSEKLHRTPEQEDRENIYYVDSSNLSSEQLEKMTQVLLEKQPRIVFSYASTLVELGKYIDRRDIDPKAFGLRSALTAGEGIAEGDRRMLERVFGCPLYRRYSDMELGIMGQDKGNGGEYILNYGSYYFECLKIDRDEPADSGEVGRIVVTDLFNYAFPMIRYDTGDLGVMEYFDDGRLPVLKEIYGRSRDCVYATNGDLVSPAKISVSMWGAAGVSQWQFLQEDRNRYILKINGNRSCDYGPILDKMRQILGIDAQVSLEFVDEFPVVASNKRRAIICNYDPNTK